MKYQKICMPKFGQKLTVKRDKINLFDPYVIGLYCKIKGKIEEQSLIGHLPWEILRFCRFFLEYDGLLDATVRAAKFRRSSLPQGGLKIPIKLYIPSKPQNFSLYFMNYPNSEVLRESTFQKRMLFAHTIFGSILIQREIQYK